MCGISELYCIILSSVSVVQLTLIDIKFVPIHLVSVEIFYSENTDLLKEKLEEHPGQ